MGMFSNRKQLFKTVALLAVSTVAVAAVLVVAGCKKRQVDLNLTYISPSDAAVLSDGSAVVTDAGKGLVYKLSADGSLAKTYEAGATVSGVAVSDSGTVYVTAGEAAGKVIVLDGDLNQKAEVAVGHTPVDPALSPDGTKLYVANRYSGNVSIVDTANNQVTGTVGDLREPYALAVAADGSLYVGAHLPSQIMTDSSIGSVVQKIAADGAVTEIAMTNGTTSLKDMCVSPDGKYLVAAHIIARYGYPTTQLDRGWINTNALSLVDLSTDTLYATVLLDGVDHGAANPYGVTFTSDGQYVVATVAGTNEIEAVHYEYLLDRLKGRKETDVPSEDDMTFLDGIRYRITLPGVGSRAITAAGDYLYICQYFTGNVVKMKADGSDMTQLSLGNQSENNVLRTGEIAWNDGTLCYQGWQTCASCHPDGRVDALNWDNLNDGVGNSKQTKSLLYSYFTPPEMITGIRASAEIATRAGMKYIEFAAVGEDTLVALDEYIKSFEPVQSPYLNTDGTLTEEAKRGKELFESADVGCASCHTGSTFTNLHAYDVGTVDTATDGTSQVVSVLDTPTLVEVWRTAPYLYNGKAASIYDVLTTYNKNDTHGRTSHLTEAQLKDLEAYVLSIGEEGESLIVETVSVADKDGENVTPFLIVPGKTFDSLTVRNISDTEQSAKVTFEFFDKNGNSLGKKSGKTGKLQPNYTGVVKLKMDIPAELEQGAYYTVTFDKGASALKVTY